MRWFEAALSFSLAPGSVTLVSILLGCALAALVTFTLSIVVVKVCTRWRILDRPSERRIHARPVPRLGGIAIFVSFVGVTLLLYQPSSPYEATVYRGLLLAAVVLVAVMVIDDVRGLPPLLRLGAQTVAAGLAIYPAAHGTLIQVVHNPLVTADASRTFLPLWIAVPFTWFWIVGMMNTINWVDGLDGLAGGVVTITALAMACISWLLGQHTAALLCAALAGATLGFLPFNWHPARLFMGDAGAMFLGLALAVLANVGGSKLAMMLLLLGLPILDTARVILRRVRQGHSPLHFDFSHLHHRLLVGGLTSRQIVLLFYSVTALFGGMTILAAYLQVHESQRQLHLFASHYLAVSEIPTLLGLVFVAVVSAAIWRIAAVRRRRTGLPPGASSMRLTKAAERSLSASASGSRKLK